MLYNDIKDVKNSAGHARLGNGKIDALREDILAVENELIRKYIGQAQYNAIKDSMDNITEGSKEETLLMHVRRYVSAKALWRGSSKINVTISKAGISSDMSDSHKPVREWMLTDVKNQLLNDSCEYLDILLAYMHENKDDLEAWTASKQYAKTRSNLINDLDTFEEYYSLNGSYSTFYNLKATMKHVEDLQISKVVGSAFFIDMKNKIVEGDLDNDFELLLTSYLYRLTVYHTVIRACKTMGVALVNGGVKINEYLQGMENSNVQRQADYKERELLMQELSRNAEDVKCDMYAYLNSAASDTVFPLWKASSLYVNPDAEVVEVEVNKDESGFFSP